MTDNEIIKALECCVKHNGNCDLCEIYDFCREHNERMPEYTLDLINRLQAKNSNLQAENSNLTSDLTSLKTDLTSAKAENERLKTRFKEFCIKRTKQGERTTRNTLHLQTVIAEQKAEIERLEEENEKKRLIVESIDDNLFPLPFETDYDKAIKIAKAEAVKEFAERLKSKAKTGKGYLGNVYCSVTVNDVDETYREMVGDNNAE